MMKIYFFNYSNFGQVTSSGCVVNYKEQCPKSWQQGILWPRTDYGKKSPHRCPRGSRGFAFRYCDEEDLWLDANLRNCTSDAYYDLALMLADVNSGKAPLITRYFFTGLADRINIHHV